MLHCDPVKVKAKMIVIIRSVHYLLFASFFLCAPATTLLDA
jgi:hypothetical protein